MSPTMATILGIVIGLCMGVFLMGLLVMSRAAEDEAYVKRAEGVIEDALEQIENFGNVLEAQALFGYPDRIQGYTNLVASLQKTLLGHSTNG